MLRLFLVIKILCRTGMVVIWPRTSTSPWTTSTVTLWTFLLEVCVILKKKYILILTNIYTQDQFAKFKTKRWGFENYTSFALMTSVCRGRQVTSLGVLYNFTDNDKNTTVQPPADMVKEAWVRVFMFSRRHILLTSTKVPRGDQRRARLVYPGWVCSMFDSMPLYLADPILPFMSL
jgi:hypothetical protein